MIILILVDSNHASGSDDWKSIFIGSSSQSIPEEEDGPEGRSNKNSDGMQSKERSKQSKKESHTSQHVTTDWRTFRANLVAREQVLCVGLAESASYWLTKEFEATGIFRMKPCYVK